MAHGVEAVRALKPTPRTVLPPGEHNEVSVHALFHLTGRESWMI